VLQNAAPRAVQEKRFLGKMTGFPRKNSSQLLNGQNLATKMKKFCKNRQVWHEMCMSIIMCNRVLLASSVQNEAALSVSTVSNQQTTILTKERGILCVKFVQWSRL